MYGSAPIRLNIAHRYRVSPSLDSSQLIALRLVETGTGLNRQNGGKALQRPCKGLLAHA